MSTNANVTRPDARRRVLLVAANPSTSPVSGWPIGFWWSELVHPFQVFEEAGYEIEIRSPDGGRLEADGYSDPEHESGYSASDFVSLGFKRSPTHAALIENTPSLADVNVDDYDAVFLSGGQSPMVTFIENETVHALVRDFLEAGKVTALVCHATCALLRAKGSDGNLLVQGRTWTGFADTEERVAEEAAGAKLQPFWIETEAHRLENTNFVTGAPFRSFAVRDGNLVTGQQQFSGAEAARLVVEAVGR